MSDRVAVFNNGRIEQVDAPQALYLHLVCGDPGGARGLRDTVEIFLDVLGIGDPFYQFIFDAQGAKLNFRNLRGLHEWEWEADWRVATPNTEKIKKQPGEGPPPLMLTENPDILKTIGHHAKRPKVVVGFAAETQDVENNGRIKLQKKGADLIVAKDVSPETGIMGGERNTVHIVTREGVESWPDMSKTDVADRLMEKIAQRLTRKSTAAE